MADLFDTPLVPGLSLREGFVGPSEEPDLIARIDRSDLTPFRFQQWTGKRLTRSYGWSYDFERGTLTPAAPLPDWLDALRARAASFAGLPAGDLVQVLLTRYDPEAGIGWHRDRPVFGHVLGISLGRAATLRLRRRTSGGFARAKARLAPRSIYHLTGEARDAWEHSIAPMDAPRWSITFRSFAKRGGGQG